MIIAPIVIYFSLRLEFSNPDAPALARNLEGLACELAYTIQVSNLAHLNHQSVLTLADLSYLTLRPSFDRLIVALNHNESIYLVP